ncbi:glycosyltransferases [Candidatus Scalindua japonica]|uniref:Glycosyltransferases n=1 Tax=Candidatus Scalindua japonica TaxID=1284222 RepID=A0A286U4J4_9BACT|nr:glycosyltransferase family 2 protein [Candidatus Scalindua japonica]GAX62981.1 glycosyltransferases [Candidatus Scalindua japonica]
MDNNKISIIIPYFQKESGILKKSVLSVLRQKGVNNYEIIVIDDDSPVPAKKDLGSLLADNKSIIKIIEQKNTGPAGARNRGLNSVSKDTVYVAFLDSDDEWEVSHLKNAVCGLEKGYDFYFSNFQRHFSNYSRFQHPDTNLKFSANSHVNIDKEMNLYEFRGSFFDSLLQNNFIGTPTVVYRYENYSNFRFREEFFNGEDLIFWLDFSKLNVKVVFSTNIEVFCGEGINICAGAGWGTSNALKFAQNQIKKNKYILNGFTLNIDQRTLIRGRLKEGRDSFLKVLLHEIANSHKIDFNTLLIQLKIDFGTFVLFLPNLLRIIYNKYVN